MKDGKETFEQIKKEIESKILDLPEEQAYEILLAYFFNAESLLKEFYPKHVEIMKSKGLMRNK